MTWRYGMGHAGLSLVKIIVKRLTCVYTLRVLDASSYALLTNARQLQWLVVGWDIGAGNRLAIVIWIVPEDTIDGSDLS